MQYIDRTMETPADAPWLMPIRHFIGTGDEQFLNDAIERCGEPALRTYFEMAASSDERSGSMPPAAELRRVIRELVTSFTAQSRTMEAAGIQLLALRSNARLLTLNVHAKSEEIRNARFGSLFDDALEISQSLEFVECEAYFAKILGDYARSLGDWDVARDAHSHAVVVYGRLMDDPSLRARYARPAVEATLCAAISQGKTGNEEMALYLLNLAIELWPIVAAGDASRELALSAHAAFEELVSIRQLRAASELGDLALALLEHRRNTEPGAQQDYDFALCACEAGQLHARIGHVERSLSLCSTAVDVLERLTGTHPWFYQGALGIAYGALAHAHRLAGDLEQARTCFERSAHCIRQAASQQEDPNRIEYQPQFILALNNYGSACRQTGRREDAVAAFEESEALIAELKAGAPSMISHEWMACANLCLLRASDGRPAEARSLGERAMAILESVAMPEHELWIEKGLAEDLYTFMFEQYVRAGEAANAFRCLVVLRTDESALKAGSTDTLAESLRRLAQISVEQAAPVTVLCQQTLLNGSLLVAVLRSGADAPEFVDCDSFVEPALALLQQINRMVDEDGSCVTEAEQAWSALPSTIQSLLCANDGQVLICGDQNWTSFPWEALKFGPSPMELLGLHFLLPRWHSPDAATLASLVSQIIDARSPGLTVICPWDATDTPLDGARQEAIAVSELLAGAGEAKLLLGEAATAEAMIAVLENAPAVIHYTGHGGISDGEEVLILRDSKGQALVGSREVRHALLRSASREQGRLVVLNCCYAGKVRLFGGHREDLASMFIKSGVSSVIASATPVFDDSAQYLGISLHTRFGDEPELISEVVVRARRLTATRMESAGETNWVAWCTTVYHGNPFVTYRR
jgi:tetratricopeptide (TPR) repeat protein